MVAGKATAFVTDWVDEHITADTPLSELPGLVAQCEADARNEGIMPVKLVDETGTDIKTMIEAAHTALQMDK
jgi:hypothetical protein